MGTPYLKRGHLRWFKVNCSMMLYRWTGADWQFTGTATRLFVKGRNKI